MELDTISKLETEIKVLSDKNQAAIERLNKIDPLRQQFATIELSAEDIGRMGFLASKIEKLKLVEARPRIEKILKRKAEARKRAQ